MAQRNVLIVMADEWRHDALGCAGHPVLRTPHLDRLAAQGTRCTQAFTASPLCGPARVSFFCGQYVHRHGGWSNNPCHHIRMDQTSLPSVLKDAGYRVGLAGKNHAFTPEVRDRRFDFWEEYDHWGKCRGADIRDTDRAMAACLRCDPRPEFARWPFGDGKPPLGEGLIDGPIPFPAEHGVSHRIADDAIAFLDRLDSRQPFALHVSFPDPHWPNVVCEPYYSMYDPARLPPLEAFPMDWSRHPFKYFVQSQACEYDRYTEAERKRILATAYGQISAVDAAMGRVLQRLDALRLREDTLIVFVADHGNFMGRYGLIGKTGGFQDALVRVPMIVAGPEVPAGGTCEAQVANIDVMPTLLDWAGLPMPSGVQGRSLWPVLRGERAAHRTEIFAEVNEPTPPPPPVPRDTYAAYNRMRKQKDGWFWFVEYVCRGRSAMLRRDGWKYAFHTGDREELYDLQNDPLECRNLATAPEGASQKDALKNRLMTWLLTAPLGDETAECPATGLPDGS